VEFEGFCSFCFSKKSLKIYQVGFFVARGSDIVRWVWLLIFMEKTRKKILFYTDTPLFGGAENQMLLLARFLDSEKYEVVLVCSNYVGLDHWVRQWSLEGFKIYTLRVVHKHDPRHLTQLKKVIKLERPDLLHFHLWNPGACRYGFMAVSRWWGRRRIPIVVTEHDPFALHGIKNLIKSKNIKKTAGIISISKANRKLLLEFWPEMKSRIFTVYNGIDTTWFSSQFLSFTDEERQKVRRNLFMVEDSDKVVLTIATLHPRKGLKYLIEAAEAFRESVVKFVIVGDGPQRRELSRLIKSKKLGNNVFLLGQQKNISRILKSSDLFVLPSIKEAFGLVLLEAMIARLPVISTDAGGVPEIVLDGKTGLLVPSRDALALKAAIEEVVSDDGLAEKFGNAGFDRVNEFFDAKIMAKKTAEVYEGCFIKNA